MLINHAFRELVAERMQLTQDDLVAKIHEIDLSDGVEDGKLSKVEGCPDCRRTMRQRHNRCLYCGGEFLEQSPFQQA